MLEHPELARIEGWRKLEGVGPSNTERTIYKAKIDTIAGDDATSETADVFTAVLALAVAWLNAPQAIQKLATQDMSHQRQRFHETVSAILA